MQQKYDKGVMVVLAVAGCLLTAYGMIEKNNTVFFIGLAGIIGAYLIFRKRLKTRIVKRER